MDSIGGFVDALRHYRSFAGGRVPANENLINEMKNDNSYKKMIKELRHILTNKGCSQIRQKNFSPISAASGSMRGISCQTLGSYGVNIEYKFTPKFGENWIEIHFYGYDSWDFNDNKNYNWFQNVTREKIPGMIAGKGKEYDVTFDFKEWISVALLDGIYYVKSKINNNFVWDIIGFNHDDCAKFAVYEFNGKNNQQFLIRYDEKKHYTITCVFSGKCIDIANGQLLNENIIWQYHKNGTDAQSWDILVENGKDYTFRSIKDWNYVINLRYIKAENENRLWLYHEDRTDVQYFNLQPCLSFIIAEPLLNLLK